jgi:hypothetical protein
MAAGDTLIHNINPERIGRSFMAARIAVSRYGD